MPKLLLIISFFALSSCSAANLSESEKEAKYLSRDNGSRHARFYKSNLFLILQNIRMYEKDVAANIAERDKTCSDYSAMYPDLMDAEMREAICDPNELKETVQAIWGSESECLSLIDEAKQNLRGEGIYFIGPRLQAAFNEYSVKVCAMAR